MPPMRIVQIGNFEPEYSTENEILDALLRRSHDVSTLQEQDAFGWKILNADLASAGERPDMIVWTSTISLNDQVDFRYQYQMLDLARRFGVPTVAVHLDRWWGLDREHQLDRPFFACQYVYTADGGHQEQFRSKGINHFWMPPAISERWCQPGTPKPEYDCDVVFVGGWRDYGHKEWTHRRQLVEFLSETYGDRFLALPRRNQPAIRGLELNDVYWSAKVCVGDSCLVPKPDGSPMTHYCSDRIPETVGRGGYLLHPAVEGITPFGVFYKGAWPVCDYWDGLGEWDSLRHRIDEELETGEWGSEENRLNRIEFMKKRHTYTVRMGQVLDAVADGGREIA